MTFDLEKAAQDWSRSRQARGCNGSMSRDELVDHLLCETERLTSEQNMTQEAAFEAAKTSLININPANPNQKKAVIANAVIWAVLMLATAIVFVGSTNDKANFLITVIFVPLWWVSDAAIRRFTAESAAPGN